MRRTFRGPASTHLALPPATEAPGGDDGTISAQAMRLHALGSMAALLADRHGLIGRGEAERLADSCGALVDELIDAGLWAETDFSYMINALAT